MAVGVALVIPILVGYVSTYKVKNFSSYVGIKDSGPKHAFSRLRFFFLNQFLFSDRSVGQGGREEEEGGGR